MKQANITMKKSEIGYRVFCESCIVVKKNMWRERESACDFKLSKNTAIMPPVITQDKQKQSTSKAINSHYDTLWRGDME
jgi:hypothetical protein